MFSQIVCIFSPAKRQAGKVKGKKKSAYKG